MHGAIELNRGEALQKNQQDKVYDCLASDLPINTKWAPAVVDDPYDRTAKLKVLRSVRDDPLAALHSREQIKEHEYQAGRRWQRYYELAEIGGARAIDPTKEAVDGGRMSEPLGLRQLEAFQELKKADKALGDRDKSLVRDILGTGQTLAEAAQGRGLTGDRGVNYIGRRFRDALDTLAILWGLSSR